MREKAYLWKCTILQELRFILSVKNINDYCVQLRFWNLIRGWSSRGTRETVSDECYFATITYLAFEKSRVIRMTYLVKVPHKWLKKSGKWPTLSLSNVMSRNPICNATFNVLWNLTYWMLLSVRVNSVKPIWFDW